MSYIKISLNKLDTPVMTGFLNGRAQLKLLDLEAIDSKYSSVVIKVPFDTYAISSSFFRGLFEDFVIRAGTSEQFFDKYQFEGDSRILASIRQHVHTIIVRHRICQYHANKSQSSEFTHSISRHKGDL